MKRVTIDPITRLEGHGRIEILLDDAGAVANAYFQVPELRGFEALCLGRHAEQMPVITSRICGICPEAHHLAAAKALDRLFDAPPPRTAQLIRELLYCAFFVTDHATHFYALGGPDLLLGPDAPPAERNLLGVVRRFGEETGRAVIACRARCHRVIELLGGRSVHPVAAIPGGWSRRVAPAEAAEIGRAAGENVAFALATLQLFRDVVLPSRFWQEALAGDLFVHRTYSMGTVDPRGRANFLDGLVRVVDPDGAEVARFDPQEYRDHLAERVEPWTYLKVPYLRRVGWAGFTDGPASGVYCATPLARLNVADGLTTPLADEELGRYREALGVSRRPDGRFAPVHHRMATHWARLVELLHAAERMAELARDPELCGAEHRRLPGRAGGTGIAAVEAPRGTLFHHYESDERGRLTKVNLIVGTTNNYAAMAMSVRRAAERLIRPGVPIGEGTLNRIETAFRLYDPCLSCATHLAPGGAGMEVVVRAADGATLARSGGAVSPGGPPAAVPGPSRPAGCRAGRSLL